MKVSLVDDRSEKSDSPSLTLEQAKEFNDEVKRAIDGAIYAIVGQDVLRSLRNHLKTHYDITPDEIPYRLDTLFETLEHTFGLSGARTLSRAIARRIYYRYNIDFIVKDGYKLQDYLEDAKQILIEHYGNR